MGHSDNKPLMRSLGEFFGHIVKGIRTDTTPSTADPERTEVRRETEEEHREDMILRRTTIEEIEFKREEPND